MKHSVIVLCQTTLVPLFLPQIRSPDNDGQGIRGVNMNSSTQRLAADNDGIKTAAALLRAGQLVAFPTETVYGLGADARNSHAVASIFAAKQRPHFNPLIVHLPGLAAVESIAELPDSARALAAAFWPGPLTLVLKRHPDSGLSDLVTAGLDTVAVRIPEHPLARRLLSEFGAPVAAPSANPSGKISPTTADHVLEGLSGKIAAVLDGGPCGVGLESTILGFTNSHPILLRTGGIPVEAIESALGQKIANDEGENITAPGQLKSHYAPSATMRLDATAPESDEVWLGFGPDSVETPALNLSPNGDLHEAAANLFAHMRALDKIAKSEGLHKIAVAVIPHHGLGAAINDRLERAAAPRA